MPCAVRCALTCNQVDVIGTQAQQGARQRGAHVLGAIAAHVRSGAAGKARLGGQHQPVAQLALGDEGAHHLFAAAARIYVGRIDADALAGMTMAVIQGMSTAARDGAPREKLLRIAAAALAAWPK